MAEHPFTEKIKEILKKKYGDRADEVFAVSKIIQYLNYKSISANRDSKARSSWGNFYAIYVLVEDYIKKEYHLKGDYGKYDGANYSVLMKRMKELPFGSKLQNHPLNARLNDEYKKLFKGDTILPVIRDVKTKKYWFNESLLKIKLGTQTYNIAESLIEIINAYVSTKKDAFEKFIQVCEELKTISKQDESKVNEFIMGLLEPNVDARIFEIVSYSILKYYYHDQTVYFGETLDTIEEYNLVLYKTGRTNANDGGIDFVMKPLGRFFQVTETLDVKKYFLDIDKIEKFPISFVIKSSDSIVNIKKHLKDGAKMQYTADVIVDKYMECIEEVINIPVLQERFESAKKEGYLSDILGEIIIQSKVEFNYEDGIDEEDEDDDQQEVLSI